MDIVERLQICAKNDPHDTKDNIFTDAADEIKQLRQQNAELVEALKWIVKEDRRANQFRTADYHGADCKCWRCAIDNAEVLIAKATGGE